MRFNKKFHKTKGAHIKDYTEFVTEYFDFLRSLDIEFDDEVLISEILNRKNVEYLERGELYLGIGKTEVDGFLRPSLPKMQIILYVNPIEWSLPDVGEDKSIGMLRIERQEFLKLVEKFKGKSVNVKEINKKQGASWQQVGNERGSLKEYSGERSFYMTHFDFYPISVQVGIINWMW